jgi:hypothetical protein
MQPALVADGMCEPTTLTQSEVSRTIPGSVVLHVTLTPTAGTALMRQKRRQYHRVFEMMAETVGGTRVLLRCQQRDQARPVGGLTLHDGTTRTSGRDAWETTALPETALRPALALSPVRTCPHTCVKTERRWTVAGSASEVRFRQLQPPSPSCQALYPNEAQLEPASLRPDHCRYASTRVVVVFCATGTCSSAVVQRVYLALNSFVFAATCRGACNW